MNYQDRIEAYLNGTLSDTERLAFEKEISVNEELKKEYELHLDVIQGVEALGKIEIKKEIQEASKTFRKNSPDLKLAKTKKNKRLYIILMLCFLSIVSFLIYKMLKPNPNIEKDLFAEYFEPYLPDPGNRSNHDQVLIGMIEEYKKGNFQLLTNQIQSFEPKNNYMVLLYGQAKLELNDTEGAIASFRKIIQSKDPYFELQAKWFFALASLKANNLFEAKNTLSELIILSDGPIEKKASALLESIKAQE